VWTCGKAALKEVRRYTCLGLVCCHKHGIAGAFSELQNCMLESSNRLWDKFDKLHCST